MKKKQMTDTHIMKERALAYGPVNEQMQTIGVIQMELSRYCLERNDDQPSREALGHLAAMNQAVVKLVRSVSNRKHEDNYRDGRNFLTISDEVGQ